MALDGLFLNRIIHKLSIQTPLKIQRIYHVSENELVFIVRNHDAKMQLLLSAHSVHNRLQFSNQNFVYPQEPSNFVMLLRKHLEDGLILSIKLGWIVLWSSRFKSVTNWAISIIID